MLEAGSAGASAGKSMSGELKTGEASYRVSLVNDTDKRLCLRGAHAVSSSERALTLEKLPQKRKPNAVRKRTSRRLPMISRSELRRESTASSSLPANGERVGSARR